MAYLFNGATHIINRADAILQSWPITFHGRIRLTANNDGLTHNIVYLSESAAHNGFRILVESNASTMKARCGTRASGSAASATTTTSISDTNWHSVVGEITSASARQVWLDNGGNGSNATSLTPGTLTKTVIGAQDSGGALSGNVAHELADIAVWSGTLTTEERAALAAGVSPALIRPDILEIYLPLMRGGSDYMGGVFTVTNATVADHPLVYMPARSTIVPKTAASGGITGSASITDADDAVSSTGTLAIAGLASITEADDAATGAGALLVVGTASIAEADDALSSASTLSIAAVLAATEADDTLSATGVLPIVGTLSATEDGDTLTADGVGSSVNSGTASITEEDDTLAAAATLPIVGTASITEADDAATGAGGLLVTGAASIAEADDTIAATGALLIKGVLAANDNDDILAATGAAIIVANPERKTGSRPAAGPSTLRLNLSRGARPAALSGR